MTCRLLWRFLHTSFFVLSVSVTTFGQINHDLKIKLNPDSHRIEVVDKITLPPVLADTGSFQFILHQGLKPEVLDKDTILRKAFAAETGKFFNNNPSAIPKYFE